MGLQIPAPLRGIQSGHRDRIIAAFGSLGSASPIQPPDADFLFLCFTNRCGSNYLAHLLAATGGFNEAGEYFNADTVLEHASAQRLGSLHEYFGFLCRLVAQDGRVCAKAGIDQLIYLTDSGLLDAVLPRSRFVLLERRDRLGQAISRVIARQNGRWTSQHASDVPDSALVYSRAAIETEMAVIELANYAFYRFFAANGIAPVHITYEALLADPAGVLAEIGGWVGMPDWAAITPTLRIRRQANAVNQAWRARYAEPS